MVSSKTIGLVTTLILLYLIYELLPTEGLSAPVLRVTSTSATVIFIEWSQVDAASHYTLVIRKQGSSRKRELTVEAESIILNDLSPNCTYCFSVSARNSHTSGPESEPVCAQTEQGLLLEPGKRFF